MFRLCSRWVRIYVRNMLKRIQLLSRTSTARHTHRPGRGGVVWCGVVWGGVGVEPPGVLVTGLLYPQRSSHLEGW